MDAIGLIPPFIRSSLDDLQPFEETVVRRMGNLRAIGRQVSLRPPPGPSQYPLLSAQLVVESINDIPTQFERGELAKRFEQLSRESLHKAPEIEKYVRAFESDKATTVEREKTSKKIVAKYAEYAATHLEDSLKSNLTDYMESDFPFAVFDEFSLFKRAYTRFLAAIVDARERAFALVSMAHRSRGLEGSKVQLRSFKERVGPLLQAGDIAWISYAALQIYIDIKHSATYDEIGKDKLCSIENLDQSEFERLLSDLIKKNEILRQELLKFAPRTSQQSSEVRDKISSVWLELNQIRADSWEMKA